jgi:hypothetical protein
MKCHPTACLSSTPPRRRAHPAQPTTPSQAPAESANRRAAPQASSLEDQRPPPPATQTATPTPTGAPPQHIPQPRRPRPRRRTSRLQLPGAGSGAQNADHSTLAASFPEHDAPHDANLLRSAIPERAGHRTTARSDPTEKRVGGEPGAPITHERVAGSAKSHSPTGWHAASERFAATARHPKRDLAVA